MQKARHVFVEERTEKIREYSETSEFNKVEINDTKIGVITAGITYQYAKEALGDKGFIPKARHCKSAAG